MRNVYSVVLFIGNSFLAERLVGSHCIGHIHLSARTYTGLAIDLFRPQPQNRPVQVNILAPLGKTADYRRLQRGGNYGRHGRHGTYNGGRDSRGGAEGAELTTQGTLAEACVTDGGNLLGKNACANFQHGGHWEELLCELCASAREAYARGEGTTEGTELTTGEETLAEAQRARSLQRRGLSRRLA